MDDDVKTTAEYLKAFASEVRLKLLGLVATGERSVGEMAEILNLKEPTISHHLAKLATVGLVTMRPEGTTHVYRLNSTALHEMGRDLFTTERVSGFAPVPEIDAWEQKVLRTYLVDDRLTKIPDVRKKRDVVLRWIASLFEPDRRYPEPEVNEIIGRVHPDFATLRRELIGARLMHRENSVYWKLPAASDRSAA